MYISVATYPSKSLQSYKIANYFDIERMKCPNLLYLSTDNNIRRKVFKVTKLQLILISLFESYYMLSTNDPIESERDMQNL